MIASDDYRSLIELLDTFPDEKSCVEHLVTLRWPTGPICPHCGSDRKPYNLTRSHGFRCAECRKDFSVRKGTIFEQSHLPLRKWFAAFWLFSTNRKGISSCQLSREVGVTQKTAWYMLGRIREVAAKVSGTGGPMDGDVEADEAYIGGKAKNMHAKQRRERVTGRGGVDKYPVAGVLQRGGRVKTLKMSTATTTDIHAFVKRNVRVDANLYTDEHASYRGLGAWYNHEAVKHSMGEYVRGEVHTNGIESFWSILKRGYVGIFHHWTWKHMHRYLAEFETRWSMDRKDHGGRRTDALLSAVGGLRLTYAALIE